MTDEAEPSSANARPSAHQRGTDGADLILAAFDFVRGFSQAGGSSSGPPTLACQKENLRQWADRLGLLLNPEPFRTRLTRGGQEHDFFRDGERIIKVTRNGVFGLSPGIELALVSSSQDARRFHLWEATPLEYLERPHLQNPLVPGLNSLVGVIVQRGDEMAIVISQPRFDIMAVTSREIKMTGLPRSASQKSPMPRTTGPRIISAFSMPTVRTSCGRATFLCPLTSFHVIPLADFSRSSRKSLLPGTRCGRSAW
jgi:hypothetical protein